MSLPTPYYQNDLGTLYHGDCMDILPHLEPVDLCLTDPPYGIGFIWVGGFGRGWSKSDSEKNERNTWDAAAPKKETFDLIARKSNYQIIWGGNYFELKPSRGWLVWNKPERGFTLSEAELAWTSFNKLVRVFDYKRHVNHRSHPTQKPTGLFMWCLKYAKECTGIVLDPFLGSGTTAVACERLKRRWIGIEISLDYCRIAKERIERERKQLKLF